MVNYCTFTTCSVCVLVIGIYFFGYNWPLWGDASMGILHVHFCKVTKDLVEVLEDPGSNELTVESRGLQRDVVYLG
jgi:hypothetical protein